MQLPINYIVQKFYQYAGNPKFKSYTNTYEASCPICREGKSWGKKRRLYYVVEDDRLYCKNTGRSWTPYEWIKEISGLDYADILKEASEFDDSLDQVVQRYENSREKKTRRVSDHTLPFDSINLFDRLQVQYHRNNRVVIDCLKYIQERRLDTAINHPRTFYVSLNDHTHMNRLCIPFIDKDGKILFYQTRAIYSKDVEATAKYLSKAGADKSVFGVNSIDVNFDYIFIFEGPIDAMFVKNGVAAAGIDLSELQQQELEPYRFHKKIWFLDNPFVDKEAMKKIKKLIDRGEIVYIPPKEFREFKDLNELCVHYKLNYIGPGFIVKNSYEGMKATLELQSTSYF